MAHEPGQPVNVKPYLVVFVALLALTIITVAVAYWHLPFGAAVALALVIASIKGSLVASYFMHLVSERKLILVTMFFTVLAFFAVLVGPWITEVNEIFPDSLHGLFSGEEPGTNPAAGH